jgi:hypothetical protein
MVTGRKAFDADSPASIIAAVLERDPPPISAQRPDVPTSLEWVLGQCLAPTAS